MTPPRPSPWDRLSSWWGRLDTAARLQSFGSAEVAVTMHEPLRDPERPGVCPVDGLKLDDPLHDRHLRKRAKARHGTGNAVIEAGWR